MAGPSASSTVSVRRPMTLSAMGVTGVLWVGFALLIVSMFVAPGLQREWEARGAELSAIEIWWLQSSFWLSGSLHPNQTAPGIIFLAVPLVALTIGTLWLWQASRQPGKVSS